MGGSPNFDCITSLEVLKEVTVQGQTLGSKEKEGGGMG